MQGNRFMEWKNSNFSIKKMNPSLPFLLVNYLLFITYLRTFAYGNDSNEEDSDG